jgi:hypothetical protein
MTGSFCHVGDGNETVARMVLPLFSLTVVFQTRICSPVDYLSQSIEAKWRNSVFVLFEKRFGKPEAFVCGGLFDLSVTCHGR